MTNTTPHNRIKKKVAIIDDSDADIELFKRALLTSDYDFEISSTTNTYSIPRILQEEQPEIVFIDYYLGEETGTNIIESLATEKGQIDFVVLSSRGDEAVVSEALRAGAADYLSKDDLTPERINIFMQRLHRRTVESLRLQSILRVTSDCIITLDETGTIESCNTAAKALFGIPTGRLISSPIYEFLDSKSAPMLKNILGLSTFGGENPFLNQAFELTIIASDKRPKDVELVINHFSLYGESHYTAIIRDISSRKAKAVQLDRQAAIIQATSDFVGYGDSNGQIVYINLAGLRMLGLPPNQVLNNRYVSELFTEHCQTKVKDEIANVIKSGKQWNGELALNSKNVDSPELPVSVVAIGIKQELGRENGFALIMRDISDEKAKEQRLQYAATHDPLTGLSNRACLKDRIEQALQTAARNESQIALLYLDLDNFKTINDTLGHKAGDELLKIIARRLTSVIRGSDLAARLGGDEFVVLMEQIENTQAVMHLAERIKMLFGTPIYLENQELYVTPSIGIATYPNAGETADALLQSADSAMYLAKKSGRNRFQFYSENMQRQAMYEDELKNELRQSLQDEKLTLYYQPIYDSENQIEYFECLLRWIHPEKGILLPEDFLIIAEQSGIICEIGRWVIDKAFSNYRDLIKISSSTKILSINLSTAQFQDEGLINFLSQKLDEYSIAPDTIILEILESAIVGETRDSIANIRALSDIGFLIALDNFGSGLASFNHLQQLPISYLKIDKEFVGEVSSSSKGAALVNSMILLAKALNIKTIAEGIETEHVFQYCRDVGSDYFQGFYLCEPKELKTLTNKSSS